MKRNKRFNFISKMSMYCVAEIATEVSMLTSYPRPILSCNTIPSTQCGPLTAWLTELTN